MEVWAGLPADVPVRSVGEIAARAEALGFDGIHVPETIHDSFLLAQLAIGTTTRLRVRTSVALAFPRSPMITAYAAWDLQDLSEGRFELGVGTQVRGNIEGRFAVPWTDPVGKIGEYIDALRAIFAAFTDQGPLVFHGTHYRFDRLQPYFNPGSLPQGPPPIWLGGVGTAMWRLAGERADGIVTHPTSSDAQLLGGACLAALTEGERRAGRPPGATGRIIGATVLTGRDDAAVAAERNRQRQLLAFLYSTPAYRPTLDRHGLGHLGERLHTMSLEQRWDDLTAVLTDDVIDQLVGSASYGRLASFLVERYGAFADGFRLALGTDPADDDLIAEVIADLHALPART